MHMCRVSLLELVDLTDLPILAPRIEYFTKVLLWYTHTHILTNSGVHVLEYIAGQLFMSMLTLSFSLPAPSPVSLSTLTMRTSVSFFGFVRPNQVGTGRRRGNLPRMVRPYNAHD